MNADAHRLSFGAVAAGYDQARPTYPMAALSWTFAPLGSGPLRVVDLGAGTGLLTRVVAAAEQRRLLDQVAELCATHPELAGRDAFDLPYLTTVYRAITVRAGR